MSARSLVLAAALLGVLAPDPAHAWCRMTTSTRRPTPAMPCVFPDPSADPPEHYLAWQNPCSAIAFSAAAPSSTMRTEEVQAVFMRAIATWEAVECSGVPLGVDIAMLADTSTCTGPLYRDDGGNVNAIMFVTDWGDRMYDASAFAVTTVWHRRSTGEILDVDMEINERRGPYGVCPAGGCVDTRLVDLQDIVTHELGHYLGLAHSTDPEATMYASAVAGETSKRDLSADDIEGICASYPPGHPDGACDYTPRGGLALDCATGCTVATPGRGGSAPLTIVMSALVALALARRRSS